MRLGLGEREVLDRHVHTHLGGRHGVRPPPGTCHTDKAVGGTLTHRTMIIIIIIKFSILDNAFCVL